jgi:sec-independent protein translocase protein TatB
MFDFGFSEILLIFVLALVVLGPEKLPRVVREVGRWVGRARAMARQFQEQLEEEMDVDRARTIRPEPVRPVGGVPPSVPEPLPPDPVDSAPTPATSWQPGAEPLPEAAVSGDTPAEAPTPGIHDRGT